MAGNLVISQINGGPIGVINAIINGNFQVNQRGVSGTVTLAAGAYGHDRWKAGASGCTYTFATVDNVTTLTISAGSLIQVIEGLNLYSGTYTLSWTGTAQGKIGAGSYAGSGVTGSVTGGTNLNIEFGTGTLSLVQFEPGVEASPFERRAYGQELALCQRYFIKYGGTAAYEYVTPYGMTYVSGSNYVTSIFPVEMRSAPTVSYSTLRWSWQGGGANATAVAVENAATKICGLTVGTAGGETAYRPGVLSANNSTSAFLTFSSEL